MRGAYSRSDALALSVLTIFPLIAYAEPLLQHRLLGPGDGVALHLPMRIEAFRAYREGMLPFFNPKEFLGTPLLEAYRGGVLYPLTILLAPFEVFSAFQALVVLSIALAGVLTYFYLKRLGAGAHGAFVSALSFAYGPYLLGHFEDTATLVAAPLLPLVMLTAESHMNRASVGRMLGLAASLALLVFAGSPEALRAGGALLLGRLLLGHFFVRSARGPSSPMTASAILLGLAFSAPQWLPTLQMLPEAGRQVTGLASEAATGGISGLAGLILKTVTHTPAASLAIASLPLIFERLPVRVLLLSVLAALALQIGRGPLLAPGALPLVVEFALAALAGIALDEQWKERRTRRGRRLRAYFLVASLASAGVLSVAAATLGGLPDRLAAAVGVYAIALITYFALADAESHVAAGVFLLPLAVSFALQPTSREVFKDAPTRSQLVDGTPTRRAVDFVLRDIGPSPRVLTLTRQFPNELALDLGFAGYGAMTDRVQANGYDPMAPVAVRRTLGEMGARGTLAEGSLMPDTETLRAWAIDAVQVPTADLLREEGAAPWSETRVSGGERRLFAIPFQRIRSIRVAVTPGSESRVRVLVRVNGAREVVLDEQETKEGVIDARSPAYRADAVLLETMTGRAVDVRSIRIETLDGTHLEPSALSAYLSNPAFEEIAATPHVRAFRVTGARAVARRADATPVMAVGPASTGVVTFARSASQETEIAIPYLPGWGRRGDVRERDRALVALPGPEETVRLRYVPRLFPAGCAVALAGLAGALFLLLFPLRVPWLLTSARNERK